MKINLPIEETEVVIPDDAVLVSRTDKKGVITYTNAYFAEIAGFVTKELIGNSHNIVRHPDVPQAIFEDMWESLKHGECWRGVVKNRAKSGRYYWVDTCVSPLFRGDGVVAGYASVYRKASVEQIEEATQRFAKISAGGGLHPWWQARSITRYISIKTGVVLGIIAAIAAMMLGTAYSIAKIQQYQAEYNEAHNFNVSGGDSLRQIKFLMAENRSEILLASLHDPANPLSVQHAHSIDVHLAAISANRVVIERLWKEFRSTQVDAALIEASDKYWRARERYVIEGLMPAVAALQKPRNYAKAYEIATNALTRTHVEANQLADELIQHFMEKGEETNKRLRAQQERETFQMFLAMLGGAIFFTITGVMFFRGIMKPLQNSIEELQRITLGDLTQHPNLSGHGETRELSQALAMTQTYLHSILDEIAQDATILSGAAERLNAEVRQIADGTDEQHERVHQIEEKMVQSVVLLSEFSSQTEIINTNVENAFVVLEMADHDMTAMISRMWDLILNTRKIQAEVVASIESWRTEIDGRLNLDSDMVTSIQRMKDDLAPVGACLKRLEQLIDDEEPVLLGLDSITGGSREVLKKMGSELQPMARKQAIEARLQSFAVEEIHHDMMIVIDYLVDNRQASHQIWGAARQVVDMAGSLEQLSKAFKFVAGHQKTI